MSEDFGIVYRPIKLPEKSDLPQAPAFQDERLFEQEASGSVVQSFLGHSIAGSAAGDDDEFDFEPNTSAQKGLAQSAQQRAQERRKLEKKQEEEAARALEAMRAEAARLSGVTIAPKVSQEDAEAQAAAAAKAAAKREAEAALSALKSKNKAPLDALTEDAEEEEEEDSPQSKARPAVKPAIEPDVEEEEEEEEEEDEEDEDPSAAFGEDAERARLEAQFEAATLEARAATQRPSTPPAGPAVPASGGAGDARPISAAVGGHKRITYETVEHHLLVETPLQRYLAEIVRTAPDADAGCCGALFGGPGKLSPERATERDNVLCIAKMVYDSRNDAQSRMMTTIYRGITGTEFLGTASSWETVGFQRTDFTTDLRGGGLLGPLQMLYFCERYRDFVQRLYKLSQSETQNFPLMIQSIQITARCMNAMRQGKLNNLANSVGSMIVAFHEFYMAMFFEFYEQWVATEATIARMHFIMESVESVVKKDPAAAVAKFKKAMSKPLPVPGSTGAVASFTPL